MMKGALDRIWTLVLWLQITQNLSIYKVTMPANLEMFLEQLRFMIDFEGIKVDNLLSFFKPGLTVKSILSISQDEVSL